MSPKPRVRGKVIHTERNSDLNDTQAVEIIYYHGGAVVAQAKVRPDAIRELTGLTPKGFFIGVVNGGRLPE